MRSMKVSPHGPHAGPEVNLLYCTSVQDVRCAARNASPHGPHPGPEAQTTRSHLCRMLDEVHESDAARSSWLCREHRRCSSLQRAFPLGFLLVLVLRPIARVTSCFVNPQSRRACVYPIGLDRPGPAVSNRKID
jgi:hypothetical protein